VERDTAVSRKSVVDTNRGIEQEQEDMKKTENAGLKTRKPKKSFEEILSASAKCILLSGSLQKCLRGSGVQT
jgi:hypothetical protein